MPEGSRLGTVRSLAIGRPERLEGRALRSVEEALAHVQAICFKTGPPRRVGVELEWTVHHADDPRRLLDPETLRAALGEHAPRTLNPVSPQRPLPSGALLTVEPGGQVEISSQPAGSLAALYAATSADIDWLRERLARHSLVLGSHGIDPYRPPHRVLHTPRYDAMAAAFARHGPGGLTMMCATAAVQVCLDAGEPGQVTARWRALHALGPVLLALFANSSRHAGRDTGWASARMRAWLSTDPTRTRPVTPTRSPRWPAAGELARAWAGYALRAPLLCLRRPTGRWDAPDGVSFADWITGAVAPPPTLGDLDYHLSTLFPPVRPRGHLEIRWLDAQPPDEWIAPTALLVALLADEAAAAAWPELLAATAGRWLAAAHAGLRDPALRKAARLVVDQGCRALHHTDLPVAARDRVVEIVSRRLAGGQEGRR